MGAVHFSLDERLIEELQRLLPLPVLVESGTFQGDTLAAARPHFERVYSVELVEEQYRHVAERFAGDEGVTLRCGDSAAFLRELRPALAAESVLYWLDAHWCGGTGVPAPGGDQCPLLRELAAIESLNEQSVVLIDDARYFLAPPPPPNDAGQWPRLDEVIDGLRALGAGHELLVVNDVIVFHPRAVGERMRAFAAQYGVDVSVLVTLAAAGQRSRDDVWTAQRDAAELERLCAELHAAAAERLELLEKLHRDYESLSRRCAELETAAAERLALLHRAAEERLQLERRCAELETAAAERLALLQSVAEDRLASDRRSEEIERAAEQRLALLEEIAAREQDLEERIRLFEAALQQRDRRVSELERVLDQRSLELEGLRGGRPRPS